MTLLIAILIEPLYEPHQYNAELFSNVSYESSPGDLEVGCSLDTEVPQRKLPVSVTTMQIQRWL